MINSYMALECRIIWKNIKSVKQYRVQQYRTDCTAVKVLSLMFHNLKKFVKNKKSDFLGYFFWLLNKKMLTFEVGRYCLGALFDTTLPVSSACQLKKKLILKIKKNSFYLIIRYKLIGEKTGLPFLATFLDSTNQYDQIKHN